MITNYQHKRIRRVAMMLGFFFGLYIGIAMGHALTLRKIQQLGGCIAMPQEEIAYSDFPLPLGNSSDDYQGQGRFDC